MDPAAPRAVPLTVVGLGPAGPEHLGEAARQALAGASTAYLRTGRHPAADAVGDLATFDHLYEEAETFEEVYAAVVEVLVTAATDAAPTGGSVVYAVPGSPLVAERTVELLRADPRVELTVVPALSFLDLAWERLGVDPLAAGVRLVDGTRFATEAAGQRGPLLVAQAWSPQLLSDIKLAFEDGQEPAGATVLHHLGLADEQVVEVPWAELDQAVAPDHLTSLWLPTLDAPVAADLVALEDLVRTLRRECPWDAEQTHGSLARHLLEESYEVLDALDRLVAAEAAAGPVPPGAPDADAVVAAVADLEEELGDLLFQVVFHACLAAEEGRFTLADVARGVHDKLVARHPHVFGDVVAASPDVVVANWEVLKLAEKGRASVTEGIPSALPALALATKLQRKAGSAGLDLPDPDAERVEALADLAGLGSGEPEEVAAAVGRLLFTVADLARRLDVDAEEALRRRALDLRDAIVAAEQAARDPEAPA